MKSKKSSGGDSVQTVHFTITGEFITRQVRELWAEGSYNKAFKILDCMIGMTREQQEQVIFGSRKLVGENEMDLAEDNWRPEGRYPTLVEALYRGDEQLQEELHRLRRNDLYDRLRDNFYDLKARGRIYEDGVKKLGEVETERIFREVMDSRTGSCRSGYTAPETVVSTERRDPMEDIIAGARERMAANMEAAGLDPAGLPDATAMMNRGYGLKPKKDNSMKSKCGWLLPNGDYYPCGSMEHIGLSFELLKGRHPAVAAGDADPEAYAETLGWVKITSGVMGLHILCRKKVTQSQLDKIFDYCQVHRTDYEKATQFLDK